jgi:hypothetical protein
MTSTKDTRAALWAQIETELKKLAAAAPGLKSKAKPEKLYEIFVLSCIARALRSIGASLEARDSKDFPTSKLVFRFGPGLIHSPTTASGFVHVARGKSNYELQNGVRVRGGSGVLHELDVCLIDAKAASKCRSNGLEPKSSQIRLLVECKFLGKPRIPLELGREFVGLGAEFSLRIKTLVSNRESPEVHALVVKHGGTENFRTTTLIEKNVNRFVNWLANELRQVL